MSDAHTYERRPGVCNYERERIAGMEEEITRLRELNAELAQALERIVSASESDEARGGEMWWAEAVYPQVEAAKPVLAKTKGGKP